MAEPITAITLRLNRDDYSRYEADAKEVSIRVVVTPKDKDLTGNSITLSLHQIETGRVLDTQTITFGAGPYPAGVVTSFDLDLPKDGEIHLVRAGRYEVRAELDQSSAVKASAAFPVNMLTVSNFKRLHAAGIDLIASMRLMVAEQPQAITGVTITDVNPTSKAGTGLLVFTAGTVPTLSWRGGVAVPLTSGRRSAVLPDTVGGAMTVTLDEFQYPSATTQETLVIDKDRITDDAIKGYLERAANTLENEFKFPIEPLYLATEPFFTSPHEPGAIYDRKGQPMAFYANDFNTQAVAWHMNLNHHWVLRVDRLDGYLNDIHAIQLNSHLIEGHLQTGIIDILPYSQIYGMFFPLFVHVRTLGAQYIANFWRYVLWTGLPRMEAEVLQAIGYLAAIPILTQAGQARQAGLMSDAMSKDGVSRTRGYHQDGAYAPTTKEMRTWLYGDPQGKTKGELLKLKRRLRGISMVTV